MLFAATAFALTACGQAGGPSADAADPCAMLGDVTPLFGAGATLEVDRGPGDIAGICRVQSADARRGGDLVFFEGGKVTAAERFDQAVKKWDASTETPLAPIDGLGDASQIALDLPGYQTQIAFRKGERVVLIAGRSGDNEIASEAIARGMARAAAAAP
jgi:hypothetical protein